MIPDDRDDGQQAMYYQEMELETLAALARCVTAGASFDDLHLIAAQLGVGAAFKKAHAPGP